MRSGFIAGLVLTTAIIAMLWAGRRHIDGIPVPIGEGPQPGGTHAVGFTPLRLPANGDGQPLLLDVWYPAAPAVSGAVPTLSGGAGASHRPRAKAFTGASVAETGGRLPVIFYAPGWGGARQDNSFVLASLASRGFAVVGLDDIGFDARRDGNATAMDARAGARFDYSTQTDLDRSIAVANWRLQRMVEKVRRALDGLTRMAGTASGAATGQGTSTGWLMQGRLNLEQVGMLGFSFGGSVAAEVMNFDDRFVAATNIDGWHFGDSARRGVNRPLMVFNSDFPEPEMKARSADIATRLLAQLMIEDRKVQLRQAARTDNVILYFHAVEHGDFTDRLFSPPLGDYIRRWRNAGQRLRLHAIMEAYLVSFFTLHLASGGPRAGNVPVHDVRKSHFPGVDLVRP